MLNGRLNMKRHDWIDYIIAIAAFLMFTYYDVVMWQYTIFPYNISLQWNNYHLFTYGFLVPGILILMGIAARSYIIPLYAYTFIMNGAGDLVYFIMLGQPASGYMTWTGQSALVVYGKIAITMAFVMGIDLMIRYRNHHRMAKPMEVTS
jgi:hypothetical protein